MLQKLMIFVFLFISIIVFSQDNTAEIKKIEKQIKFFEEDLLIFEKFSENFLSEAKDKGLLIEDALLLKLLAFDISLLDLSFKISITKGVLESLNGSIPSGLIELQMDLLNTAKKPPMEFIKDMLSIIKDGINSLKKEKDLIENSQFLKQPRNLNR